METLKKKRSAFSRVYIARHKDRPKGMDVVKAIFSTYEELHGDRLLGDDRAVICGIGEMHDERVAFIAQHKGSNLTERKAHNFGMCSPEGFRKALRLCKLAERFNLPVISFIDTPGAYPGLDAERHGQSRAIADNLFEMSQIETPIVSVVLGEGCSGGALGVGIADTIIMLENAYYSVISPEGCASILWKNPSKREEAAEELKLSSEDLLSCGIIDKVIKEEEGFHINPAPVLKKMRDEILSELVKLKSYSKDDLLKRRYKKYRSI